jgi:hypothetical protein
MSTVRASALKSRGAPGLHTTLIVLAFVGVVVVLASFVHVLRDHVQRGKTWREAVRTSGAKLPGSPSAMASVVMKPRALGRADASAASEH